MQEPWLLVGVPVLLWQLVWWIVYLSGRLSPAVARPKLLWIPVAVCFGTGFWTVLRRGCGGGSAAMKVASSVLLLDFAGVLVYVHRAGGGIPLMMLVLLVSYILLAGLIGWVGGLTGRVLRRA